MLLRGQAELFHPVLIDKLRAALAVRLGGAGHLGDAFADEGACDDELGLAGGGLGLVQGGREGLQVVAGDGLDVPAVGVEPLRGVLALGHVGHGVERDVVGIVNEDEVIQLLVGGELACLVGDALLHAAVAGQADDVVVENRVLRRC